MSMLLLWLSLNNNQKGKRMNADEEMSRLCEEIKYCDTMLEARDFADLLINVIGYLLEHEEYRDSDIVDRFACDVAISIMETLVSELSCKSHNN